MQKELDSWGGADYGHNWYTLTELLEFNWDREFNENEVVSCGQAQKYFAKGIATGRKNRMEFVEPGRVRIDWKTTFREQCAYFLRKVIPAMQKRSADPENVRIVFWFDN